jgi:hypothetical protein
MLGLKEDENTYQIMVDYAKVEDYSIMQVLGVRVDFLGYSKIAPPFILKSLVRFAKRLNKDLFNPIKEWSLKEKSKLFVPNGGWVW